jgi:phosphoribosylamine---glycine ligase
MNILILGSGGREHAFAWKIAQSPRLNKLYIAPGNAGTMLHGENLNFVATDFEALLNAIFEKEIDMVVVGPEDPLVKGVSDFLRNNPKTAHVMVIGPGKEAAQLEGSKDFAKSFMKEFGVPTAAYQAFTNHQVAEAKQFLKTMKPPYVLKADGLAAGKGVLILDSIIDAEQALDDMLLHGKFGKAGECVVIEEFLKGIELSVFVLTDGNDYLILPEAKDYKRIGEGDTGLNTGGMGAISPVPFAPGVFMKRVEEEVVKPTIAGLQNRNLFYKGFVFIGLMKVGDAPYVIEYNVRMGDPETEVVVPRIQNDLLDLFEATWKELLAEQRLSITTKVATTVMMVSGGYPEEYEKGKPINGLGQVEDGIVFHAGTASKNNKVLSAGGRVLAFTSLADNMKEALSKSYRNMEKVNFEKAYYRKDIGFDL